MNNNDYIRETKIRKHNFNNPLNTSLRLDIINSWACPLMDRPYGNNSVLLRFLIYNDDLRIQQYIIDKLIAVGLKILHFNNNYHICNLIRM